MLDVSQLNFPEQYAFEDVAASFANYANSLTAEARTALGDILLKMGSTGDTTPGIGDPEAVLMNAALTWLGQSLKDGEWASAPPNLTPEVLAAAGVEASSDALLGLALGFGLSALYWALPIAIIGAPTVLGAFLAIQLGAFLTPLLYVLAPFAGKMLVRHEIVSWLKGVVPDLHDRINQFYWDSGSWISKHLINPLLNFFKDPIVLDLDGNGVQLISLQNSGVHFDFAGDGFAERTGWVSPGDGILAIDRNGNGVIDNGLELFVRKRLIAYACVR